MPASCRWSSRPTRPWGLQPSAKSLSFVTNHDTERTSTTLTYKSGDTYKLANYFMLAWPYGTPQVYDGFDWTSSDQSPPANSSGYVTDTVCGTGWECIPPHHRRHRHGRLAQRRREHLVGLQLDGLDWVVHRIHHKRHLEVAAHRTPP